MGRRSVKLFVLILPAVLAAALGYGVYRYQLPEQTSLEAFSKQSTQSTNVLLADKKGNILLACMIKEGNTRLVSILPTAKPAGEHSQTFQSVFQREGIQGLEKAAEQSLRCSFSGYLIIDTSGLASLADALGGVELEGKQYTGTQLAQHLHSLPLSREGAMDQQEVMLAVGRRFCAAGFWKGQSAMGKLLQITETDLSVSTLIKLGNQLIPALNGKDLSRSCWPEN